MQIVWVVMGNDFPEAVFSTNVEAQAYCRRKHEENNRDINNDSSRKIYYRLYGFALDSVST